MALRIEESVFGWAWLRTEGRGPAQVVLADERGIIVGLANGMQPRPDVAARFHNTDYLASGWSGYFHAEPSSRAINAYAISVDGKTICYVRPSPTMSPSSQFFLRLLLCHAAALA